MIRRPPRSTQSRSSAASDVYKRQIFEICRMAPVMPRRTAWSRLSLIHISEPTRLGMISYAVFCLKKKKARSKQKARTRETRINENTNKNQKYIIDTETN